MFTLTGCALHDPTGREMPWVLEVRGMSGYRSVPMNRKTTSM